MHCIIALTGLIVATLAAVGRALESGTWEGYITFGRGSSSFSPCKSRETWWVKDKGYSRMTDSLHTQYTEIAEKPYEQVYLRLRGEVSRKGQYGPLGSYQRVVYIEEILDMHSKTEDDCIERD